MILAKNKKTGLVKTFDNINFVDKTEYDIITNNFKNEVAEIVQVTEIKEQAININDFDFNEVVEMLEVWNNEEIKLFLNHSDKKIVNLVKKHLKK